MPNENETPQQAAARELGEEADRSFISRLADQFTAPIADAISSAEQLQQPAQSQNPALNTFRSALASMGGANELGYGAGMLQRSGNGSLLRLLRQRQLLERAQAERRINTTAEVVQNALRQQELQAHIQANVSREGPPAPASEQAQTIANAVASGTMSAATGLGALGIPVPPPSAGLAAGRGLVGDLSRPILNQEEPWVEQTETEMTPGDLPEPVRSGPAPVRFGPAPQHGVRVTTQEAIALGDSFRAQAGREPTVNELGALIRGAGIGVSSRSTFRNDSGRTIQAGDIVTVDGEEVGVAMSPPQSNARPGSASANFFNQMLGTPYQVPGPSLQEAREILRGEATRGGGRPITLRERELVRAAQRGIEEEHERPRSQRGRGGLSDLMDRMGGALGVSMGASSPPEDRPNAAPVAKPQPTMDVPVPKATGKKIKRRRVIRDLDEQKSQEPKVSNLPWGKHTAVLFIKDLTDRVRACPGVRLELEAKVDFYEIITYNAFTNRQIMHAGITAQHIHDWLTARPAEEILRELAEIFTTEKTPTYSALRQPQDD